MSVLSKLLTVPVIKSAIIMAHNGAVKKPFAPCAIFTYKPSSQATQQDHGYKKSFVFLMLVHLTLDPPLVNNL